MEALVFSLPGNEGLVQSFSEAVGAEIGTWTQRRFPDGEFYVRIESPVRGDTVILVSSLNATDEKILPLFLLASTLKDLGAVKVILAAPYLPYLRQDAWII